mgnify:CR=1 FL=1
MKLVRSGKLAESTLSGGFDNQFRWEFHFQHISFEVIVGDMQLIILHIRMYKIINPTVDHTNQGRI